MKPLLQILHSSISPWLADSNKRRLIVARPSMSEADLPEGVTLAPRKIKGKRVILKGQRKLANQRIVVAEWPEANQHEIALPKLACVVSGRVEYLLGENSLHCGPGHFILIPPRMPHQRSGPYVQRPDNSCTILFAYAYRHGINCWFSDSQGKLHINNQSNNHLIPNTTAVQIFNLMMEEALAGNEAYETVCNGLLSAFFALITREIQNGHYMHPGPKAEHEISLTSHTNFAGQIQEYLDLNCHKPLRLAEVASHFYMSTSQFARRLRQETDSTFGELLIIARVERAKKLLRETDWTFDAISSHLSFRSSSYFLALFHQRTGCTSVEYRRRQAAGQTEPQHEK